MTIITAVCKNCGKEFKKRDKATNWRANKNRVRPVQSVCCSKDCSRAWKNTSRKYK